ncbi:phage head closure protein [Hymenobacter sp. HSC-4F20]|uniref:phage head closure protein n=1 Tax=Hymenobacter sp. HSC-4F20 TaxID=2864135 RepID=UPI001C72EA29|nr:phage head closure protein [Hymenobacter sp. HSC-4F20]MBX0290114.1 phage head closure protein [Hymenobacter sp. HSC-4F20]
MARAGQYREQIKLVFPGASVSDGIGGWLPSTEAEKLNIWARVQELRGSQMLTPGKEISSKVYKITSRFREQYLRAEALEFHGQRLKILSATSDERRTEVTYYCQHGQL